MLLVLFLIIIAINLNKHNRSDDFKNHNKIYPKLLVNDSLHKTKEENSNSSLVTNIDQLKIKVKDFDQRVDWRERKAITRVNNQGKCGACWAYSIVETVEAMVFIKNSTLQEYSVQQMVDCDSKDFKCDGGDTCDALVWMLDSKVKLQTAKQYSKINDSNNCQNKQFEHGVMIASNFTCENFVNREEEIIKLLATHGPLVAAVDASVWQHYLQGIIQYNCPNNLNHAIQIVGYDLTGDIPYYIVRNTWGPTFGLNGYLHIEIGKNLCGIAEEVSAIDVILT